MAYRAIPMVRTIVLQTMSLDDISVPGLIRGGDVYRVDLITPESGFVPVYPGSHSALVIPMKYRRQSIGTLGVRKC